MTALSNYRPISMLTYFYLIKLYDYLQENYILRPEQFGFQPNCSTELACVTLTDHIIKQMDNMQIPLHI